MNRAALAEQVLALSVEQLLEALHGAASATGALLAEGVGAAPGFGSGPLVTTFDAALDAADRGEAPVLVVEETGPADEPAMRSAAAVVTTRGGLASHAAVVARGWGLPAVCGVADVRIDDDGVWFGSVRVVVGEAVAVDGSAGRIHRGAASAAGGAPGAPLSTARSLPDAISAVLAACDELVGGRPQVWVNADHAGEVSAGRELGALGVGLCRTEHQFLGDRLPALQQVLLGGASADAAAHDLARHQRAAVADLLRAAGGIPVVVRLLDPPLHEFLPDPLDERAPVELRDLALAWREHNPMLGVRGVRLAAVAPTLVDIQVRALLGAAADVRADGDGCDLRLLVPMVAWPAELVRMRDRIAAVARDLHVVTPPVGAMVETPAAAISSARLAEVAAFLSVGSNDLTQLTLGLSRDDAEARLVGAYRSDSLLERSPFETIDDAVVELVGDAVRRAPGAGWGWCGEHAGDPRSLERLAGVPLDYVSCSPYRVPVARLALGHVAARSVLDGGAA